MKGMVKDRMQEKVIEGIRLLQEAFADVGIKLEAPWLRILPGLGENSTSSSHWNNEVFTHAAYQQVMARLDAAGFERSSDMKDSNYESSTFRLKGDESRMVFITVKHDPNKDEEIMRLKNRLAQLRAD